MSIFKEWLRITIEEGLAWFLELHETTEGDIPGQDLFFARAPNISDTPVPRSLYLERRANVMSNCCPPGQTV